MRSDVRRRNDSPRRLLFMRINALRSDRNSCCGIRYEKCCFRATDISFRIGKQFANEILRVDGRSAFAHPFLWFSVSEKFFNFHTGRGPRSPQPCRLSRTHQMYLRSSALRACGLMQCKRAQRIAYAITVGPFISRADREAAQETCSGRRPSHVDILRSIQMSKQIKRKLRRTIRKLLTSIQSQSTATTAGALINCGHGGTMHPLIKYCLVCL